MRAYEFIFEAGPPLIVGPVPPAQQQNAENQQAAQASHQKVVDQVNKEKQEIQQQEIAHHDQAVQTYSQYTAQNNQTEQQKRDMQKQQQAEEQQTVAQAGQLTQQKAQEKTMGRKENWNASTIPAVQAAVQASAIPVKPSTDPSTAAKPPGTP